MPSTAELSANTIRVKLVKQKHGGLGFLVKQRTLKPFVLVASIVKGGVAEESGLVQIGDIILRINDIDLTDMSYPSAIEVLKAVPIDTPVVLLLRGPEGYTTYLQTSFLENGMPRTVRVTKPIHESIMGRIKKTFSGTSGPISPVKGLKRLCNGEIDGKHKHDYCEGTDKDVDSTGGDDESYKDLVTVEEFEKDAAKNAPPIHHGNGGIFGIGKKMSPLSARHSGVLPASEASKFLFRNEGRVDSEEETVLDNGAVGSPKIVLTSPKSNLTKDGQRIGTMSRALTHDSGVSESCRMHSQKKAIEIVQDEDEITVVVRGDVSVRSEDLSSTDPSIPKRFIISSTRHRDGISPASNNTNNINSNNNNNSQAKENNDSNHNNNSVSSSNNNTSLSRSGSKKKSGRSSPTSSGRASPTRRSRSPVTSPTKHAGDDEFGKGRGSEKKR